MARSRRHAPVPNSSASASSAPQCPNPVPQAPEPCSPDTPALPFSSGERVPCSLPSRAASFLNYRPFLPCSRRSVRANPAGSPWAQPNTSAAHRTAARRRPSMVERRVSVSPSASVPVYRPERKRGRHTVTAASAARVRWTEAPAEVGRANGAASSRAAHAVGRGDRSAHTEPTEVLAQPRPIVWMAGHRDAVAAPTGSAESASRGMPSAGGAD